MTAIGMPFASLSGANRHVVTQLDAPVDAIPRIRGKRGRPLHKPQIVQGDRGYSSEPHRQRLRKRGIDEVVVFAAELAPVRRIRAGFFPASIARIDELSTSARDKSISPRRRSSASNVSWMRCQTPASCHATSRRQQAVPEPHPISCGSRFHAMPERSTNTMPVSAARSGVGLRPAYWAPSST